jgi:hypothetical protein
VVRSSSFAADIVVDRDKKTITIPAKVAPRKLINLDQVYPFEVVACWPQSPYSLFGLDDAVDDPAAIEKAAEKQVARIKEQNPPDAARLLEHIAQAKATLLDPTRRAACRAAPRGEKAHETLVTIEVMPSEVHKALESLGLTAGKVANPQQNAPAVGPELLVSLEIPRDDGSMRKVPVGQLMLDMKTGKPLGKSVKFRFTGSTLVKPDPNKPDTKYAADASGTLIAIFPVTDKTAMQSTLSFEDEKFVKLESDKKLMPKEGTPVKLILEVPK